ncbi:MAG: AAA family ATPase [Magnetococcus sp. YQC-5]
MAAKIFIAYAHEDEAFKNELLMHLAAKKHSDKIELWELRSFDVGGDWRAQIQDILEICSAACLLVSPFFLASRFFKSFEWQKLLERSRRGEVLVSLVKLRPCELPMEELSDCLVVPQGNSITEFYWTDTKDELFLDLANRFAQWIETHSNTHASIDWQRNSLKLMRVDLTSFRCYSKTEIHLDPFLNVFVGDNGAGKSAILDALAIVLDAIVDYFLDSSQQTLKKQDILLGREGKQAPFARIEVTTFHHLQWSCFEKWGPSRVTTAENYGVSRLSELHDTLKEIAMASMQGESMDLPVLVYYGIRRDHYDNESAPRIDTESRFEALRGACRGMTAYQEAVQWLNFQEGKEIRQQKKAKNFDYQVPELAAVRRAITKMLTGVTNPRTDNYPPELLLDREVGGILKTFSFSQLSDGYRSMLALVMDLARRMAMANPHLPDPLDSHAVVLIDEIDLHLHPKWQQTVLGDLRRTFPQAQFIVTTHSPQVLTTVEPQHIQSIVWEGENVTFRHPVSSYGAESGRLLQDIQGVDPRPPQVEFTQLLNQYFAMIHQGKGQEAEAVEIRKKLEQWANGEEPELVRADFEMRRQELFGR